MVEGSFEMQGETYTYKAEAQRPETSPAVDRVRDLQDRIRDGSLTLAEAVDRLGPTSSSPADSLVERVLCQPSPATIAECGGPCEQGFEHCDCGLLEQLNPGPAPTDSLVERVCVEAGIYPDDARTAIRVVAAWLTEGHGDSGAWCNAAADLMEEANQ
jgi:hypothetical protein